MMRRAMFSILLLLCLLSLAHGEEPVYFADATLKAVVEEALWISDPTPADMLGLTQLTWINYGPAGTGIADLTGLEYSPLAGLVLLQTLILNNNQIPDLSPLSGLYDLEFLDIHQSGIADLSGLQGLSNLWYLNAHDNQIGDISPLGGLTSLRTLFISQNQISDISPLSELTGLQEVDLSDNQILDISPLAILTSLTSLNLRRNPLNQQAYDVYIPQIVANNPGIDIEYPLNGTSPASEFGVSISAGQGGCVLQPGEGQFTYKYNDVVCLRAQANPGFVFAQWSGTIYTSQNPCYLVVCAEHEITANFAAISSVLYVDDDAPDDPAPDDPNESDPEEDGTAEHPFDRIQEAVDLAANGDSIRVCSGTYREIVDLLGKNLDLKGIDPEDPNRMGWPVIDGNGDGPVVSVSLIDEEPNCTLTGFVLTGGKAPVAAAVSCSGSRLTLANCLIVGNRAAELTGAIVYCQDSNAVLLNCTIADNLAGDQGTALSAVDSRVSVLNSILWGNTPTEIIVAGTGEVSARYSDIAGDWPGAGCIHDDPLFARAGCWGDPNNPNTVLGPDAPNAIWVQGDYHLQSEIGRWDPDAGAWVQDAATSPCIDAGDPNSPAGEEPSPNGGIINLGVYGGTAQASRSP
jgi:hypothetical protein